MSYIGKIPATGNFVKLDAITTSSTNTYNLTSSSVAFTPESANHMLVSLNGVIQSPTTAFTVSGSTITFIPASGTLSSSDVIDFIMVYGNVLDIGTPSDNTVSASKLTTDSVIEAKIQNDAVTRDKINAISTSSLPSFEAKGDGSSQDGYLQLNCSQNSHGIKLKSPPHSASASYTLTFPNNDGDASQFLQTNGSGVMTWADAGGGLAEVDMYRLTSNFSSNVDPISSNLERTDDASFSKIGTGMSVSSGIFTFPATGLYEVIFNLDGRSNSTTWDFRISVTQNNSSYDLVAIGQIGSSDNRGSSGRCSTFVNVTNTSNVKVKFLTTSMNGSDTEAYGDTDNNRTCFIFKRLGDSQ